MNTPHIPVPIITHDGGLIIAAGLADATVGARLAAGFLAAANTLCAKVSKDLSSQKFAKGDLGNLTAGQMANLKTLHTCMAQSAKTARLAFPGQTVKLHEQFQIGAHGASDLGSFLARVDIVLASIANAANSAAFKLQGWSDAETAKFQTARNAFGPAEQYRVQSIGDAKDSTAKKNADAATLYGNILTIQNAADLQYPAADPANAGTRHKFLLGIFPPDHGGNSAQPPPTPPAAPAK
jgi:hypothetical protein